MSSSCKQADDDCCLTVVPPLLIHHGEGASTGGCCVVEELCGTTAPINWSRTFDIDSARHSLVTDMVENEEIMELLGALEKLCVPIVKREDYKSFDTFQCLPGCELLYAPPISMWMELQFVLLQLYKTISAQPITAVDTAALIQHVIRVLECLTWRLPNGTKCNALGVIEPKIPIFVEWLKKAQALKGDACQAQQLEQQMVAATHDFGSLNPVLRQIVAAVAKKQAQACCGKYVMLTDCLHYPSIRSLLKVVACSEASKNLIRSDQAFKEVVGWLILSLDKNFSNSVNKAQINELAKPLAAAFPKLTLLGGNVKEVQEVFAEALRNASWDVLLDEQVAKNMFTTAADLNYNNGNNNNNREERRLRQRRAQRRR